MKDLTINKTLGKSSSLVSSKKGLGTLNFYFQVYPFLVLYVLLCVNGTTFDVQYQTVAIRALRDHSY